MVCFTAAQTHEFTEGQPGCHLHTVLERSLPRTHPWSPHSNHTSNGLCFQPAFGSDCPHTAAWSCFPPLLLRCLSPATERCPRKHLTFPAMSLACSSRHSCCRASICLSFARRALACSVRSLARWRANAFLHNSRLEPFKGTGAVTYTGESGKGESLMGWSFVNHHPIMPTALDPGALSRNAA